MTNLVVAVSNATLTRVSGTFFRHTSSRQTTLVGSPAGGRWGPPKAFPVLYLARPMDSVTIEAYRHLVDDTEGMTAADVVPRKLWTVDVDVRDVLDLREARNRKSLGLSENDLHGPTQNYENTQAVALACNQLGLHGIIAPAAEGGGETLALFDSALPVSEIPSVRNIEEGWRLPSDPRTRSTTSAPRSTDRNV